MNLEKLWEEWKSPADSGKLQAQIWDRRAADYSQKPIPTASENPFLRLLEEKNLLTSDSTVLDIGCGAGLYSIALAKNVKSVVGVDVSPVMIEHGITRAEAEGIDNVRLSALDWAQVDIDALGFRGGFDLVFAHMTPAVADYSSFEKMNLCSRSWCVMAKPCRRSDSVKDAAFRLIGLASDCESMDDSVVSAFSYLWYKGCSPEISYRRESWNSSKSVEYTAAWCIDRARLRRELSERDEGTIREYLSDIAVNGMISETVDTTIVTMLWHI